MYDEQYQNNEDLIPTVTADELNQLKKQHVLVRSISAVNPLSVYQVAADINHPWCQNHILATVLTSTAIKLKKNSKARRAPPYAAVVQLWFTDQNCVCGRCGES